MRVVLFQHMSEFMLMLVLVSTYNLFSKVS